MNPVFYRRLGLVLGFVSGATSAFGQAVDFESQIKPLLSDRCFACHGPDENARKADLQLHTREGAFAKLADDLEVITPGKPLASELYRRITTTDPDDLMPPPESKRELSAGEKELIRRWIEQGAEWREHWAFVSVADVELPALDQTAWPKNEIDHFTLAKQREANVEPSPLAKREQRFRRLSFDLTGLPPTLAELDNFLTDDSFVAYGKAVDRLLGSPRLGERLAVHWLDLARYSDTYGYQVDRNRFVWPWRDWVIRAFNENLPYDDFLTWQLAGDLLPNATDDQRLATTFNRLHPQKVEGGSVPEEFRVEYVADRNHTFGTAMLGLTLECARCHDHKYDPISQKEYYQFFAFFNTIDEAGLYSYFTPSIPTPTLLMNDEAAKQKIADLVKQVAADEAELVRVSAAAGEGFEKWLTERPAEEVLPGQIGHFPFDEFKDGKLPNLADESKQAASSQKNKIVSGKNGNALQLTGDDGVNLGIGNFKRTAPFSVALWMSTPHHKARTVVFSRSRAWTDAGSRGYQMLLRDGHLSASLIHFWPGNAINVRTKAKLRKDEWHHVAITYDGSTKAAGLVIYVNGKMAETEIHKDNLYKNITGGGGDTIVIGQRFRDVGFAGGLVDDFRVFKRELTGGEVAQIHDGESLAKLLAKPTDALGQTERDTLREYFLATSNESHDAQLTKLRASRARVTKLLDGKVEIMVMEEMPLNPRSTFVLKRGVYSAPGERVGAATPRSLSPFPKGAPSNRLGLAKWLVDPKNPLTARVAVNHFWQLCFGQGLVRTPEDFGTQGKRPTHPGLLDWLAKDFIDNGWNVKRLLKQIVMSATYQQASETRPALEASDPENLLLARAPRYRLSAEMIRDNALSTSGLLSRRMGGAGAKPYDLTESFKPIGHDKGEGLYRRSVYTFWKRTGPAPVMMALDASKRDVCRARRENTATPLQALVLLNGPQFVEAARTLGEQMVREHGDNIGAMVRDTFRTLTSREPSVRETALLRRLHDEQLAVFEKDAKATEAFLSVGERRLANGLAKPRIAAAGILAKALMNFDESVVKR
ncbi:MAG: hypothetical protein ACJAX6_000438 [Limisphaerales bacterium]